MEFKISLNVENKNNNHALMMLLQVKMSAGDEITITDITHPNKLKVHFKTLDFN